MPHSLQALLNKAQFRTEEALSFIQNNPLLVNTQNELGDTLIHRLVVFNEDGIHEHNRQAIFKLVSTYNASLIIPNNKGETAFRRFLDQPGTLRAKEAYFLIEMKADPATFDKNGQTFIHRLVLDARELSPDAQEVIYSLSNHYRYVIHQLNAENQTVLECLMNRPDGFKTSDAFFLVRYGANPQVTDWQGQPLIHRLVTQSPGGFQPDDITAIYNLIRFFGVDINSTNRQGKSVLQHLIDQPMFKTEDALFLIEQGANPFVSDAQGIPLIHRLVTNRRPGTPESIIHAIDCLKALRVPMDTKDIHGQTVLQYLLNYAHGFHPKVAEALVIHGADPNTANKEGESLLHLLAKQRCNNAGVMRTIINFRANFAVKNLNKQTPIEVAIEALENGGGSPANISLLFDYPEDFVNGVYMLYQKDQEQLPKLNKLMRILSWRNTSDKAIAELQGKIKAAAFGSLKRSLQALPSAEKLRRLEKARSEEVFSTHRSDNFLLTFGRTTTVIEIDLLIEKVKKESSSIRRAVLN